MDTTILGRTGLRVSRAGLGCGGFSRLGISTGGTQAEAIALVKLALDEGITLIDTAAQYGTEEIVGKAIAGRRRDAVVIATKAQIELGGVKQTAAQVVESLEGSLRRLNTDHVDVFQLHGIAPPQYAEAMALVPSLLKARDQGKFRFLGITETGANDQDHAMLRQAVADGVWDVGMVAFNMLHRTASDALFPATRAAGVGTLVMHAVRSIFARPDFLADSVAALVKQGKVPPIPAGQGPLDFLVHPGGAASVTEAAYRFARHSAGVDVVLFGTGSPAHLKANVAAISRPPLPASDLARLMALFGAVSGLGLESPGAARPVPAA